MAHKATGQTGTPSVQGQLNCESTKASPADKRLNLGGRRSRRKWRAARDRQEASRANRHALRDRHRDHRVYAKWHRKYGNSQEAEKSEAVIEWLGEAMKGDAPPFPLNKHQFDPLYEEKRDDMSFGLWTARLIQIRREDREEKASPERE